MFPRFPTRRVASLVLLGSLVLVTAGCGGGGGLISIVPLADVEVKNDNPDLSGPMEMWEQDVTEFRIWKTGTLYPLADMLPGGYLLPQQIRHVGQFQEDFYNAQGFEQGLIGPPVAVNFSNVFCPGGDTHRFEVF